jgi:hypothetical protein
MNTDFIKDILTRGVVPDLVKRVADLEAAMKKIQESQEIFLSCGVYTPTLTAVANLDSVGAFECYYLRMGDYVFCFGFLNANPTTNATLTRLRISLPIASGFIANANASGGGVSVESGGAYTESAQIFAYVAGGTLEMRFISATTANHSLNFWAGYILL